ncbi:sensor histidine kinase [Roseivirga sp.]|uniref:tetratricopeptide repeat-containing sensor histidine kinase n=1 Tax=Roseivirga sp. TaxID=1964215 RepID=UPI002B2697D8|nr:sensor histidine kinase [Roseivirga sp.]
MGYNFYWMSFLKSFLSPFLVLFFLLLFPNSAFSQTSIQEEIQTLKSSLQDKKEGDKVIALKDIAMKFRSISLDSAKFYTDEAFKQAEAMNSEFYKARIWMVYGILSFDAGLLEDAQDYYQKALPVLEAADDAYLLGSVYTNLSNLYGRITEFDKAVASQLKALEYFQVAKDTVWIAGSFLNLGIRYSQINQEDSALAYYLKAMELYEKLGNPYYQATCANAIASVYELKKEYDKAITYAHQSIKGFEAIGAELDQAFPLSTLAIAYRAKGDLIQSEKYFLRSLEIHEKRNERTVLLFLKNDIANVQLALNKVKQAKALAIQTYAEADALSFKPAQEVLAKTLSLIYKQEGNFKEAYKYIVISNELNASLEIDERAKEVLNLREKYETEQKENEILRQQNELVESELTLQKRNDLLLAGGGLVVLILVVAFALLREQRMKAERIKNEMALEQALVEVKAQENLKEQRIRIARDLHDNIGSQLTYITSITDTAMRNIDKGEVFMAEKLTQMKQFTLVTIAELRDTIWAMNKDEISLEDIQERTNQLAATIHDATDDEISVRTISDSSDKMLSAFVGMNLFRIIQESINNAVKHSGTSEVLVTFKDTENKVGIVVEDFGKGFDTKLQSAGNGLYIMKSRAEKAGVTFELSSEIGKGTKVELTVEA